MVNMGGKEARDGFWFQDAKALKLLLDDALERRRRQVLGLELGPELRVRVESAVEVVIEAGSDENKLQLPRPAWDGTFTIADRVVVDECKLGGPTRDDRVTLYRRLRATIASGVSVDRLVPSLTVGRDSIASPDRWRELRVAAQSVIVPTEPPRRVDSVDKLASEAIYYLTTPAPIWKLKKADDHDSKNELVVPATPELSLDSARSLLARFEIDAENTIDDLEDQLRTQIDALGATLAADELIDLLRSWIDRIARARDWPADLTADLLSERLTFVARYLVVLPAVEALWHRLHLTVPPRPVNLVVEQPWREVQPSVEAVIQDRATAPRIAFTSEGGIGKSFLLGALHEAQPGIRIWVDTTAPLQDVEAALALGAWAAQRKGNTITIFVDAIEHVADPAGLLASIDRALASHDAVVYVGARLATWAEIRDRIPRWRGVRLMRWTDERIRKLAETGRTERLSTDLIDLLRTPLLLDLFLRTFAAGDTIPSGLATRHGVLRAYFQRRVLQDCDASATGRRDVLDAGVAAILSNVAVWRNTTAAAHELISEGVVTQTFGELRFRHALLRDFAAALYLVPQSAEQIAKMLHGVESPIIRNEVLRGVIEAQLDPDPVLGGPTVAEVIRECMRCGLAPGIALGTTDAPTPALLAAIASIEDGAVLQQALTHAHLIDNRAWIRIPGDLGGERPDWLNKVQLKAMSTLAEFATRTGDAASTTLAATLRTWTWGYPVDDDVAWSIATIGALLVRASSDVLTARWYESLELGEVGSRSRFLEQLRDLGANKDIDDSTLARALDKIVFGAGTHVLEGNHSLWEVTNLCLSDHEGNLGLLTTRPYMALTILFSLSVARELEEDRRRQARPHPTLAEFIPELIQNLPAPSSEYVEAETRLSIEPTLTMTEAIGDLVDDARSTDSPSNGYVETLIDEVVARAYDDPTFADCVVKAAIASRSVHAHVIALRLRGSAQLEAVVLKILCDARIYHLRHATAALWNAIQSRWPSLTPDIRAEVQANILSRAKSPLLMFTDVGRLASAIPRDDLNSDLRPYVEFLEAAGWSATPNRPSQAQVFSGRPDDGDDEVRSPTESIWRRFEDLAERENDQTAASDAIEILKHEMAALGATTLTSTWFAVSRVIGSDEKRIDHALDGDVARVVFDAAIDAAQSTRQDSVSWGTLLDIADACPSYVAADEAVKMRTRLIAEVAAGAGEHAEHEDHAWRALVFVRPIAWFTEGTGGRAIFETWFRDRLCVESLRTSLRLLQCLAGEQRLELTRHVIESPSRISPIGEGLELINELGRLLATWSIWWEPTWARDLTQSWCEATVRPGALASAQAWRAFVSGFAWSLQNSVRNAVPDPRAEPGIKRFVPLLELSWSAWSHVIDDTDDGNHTVGWSVTAPLAQQFKTQVTPPDGSWSVGLRALVVRVLLEGGRNDLSAFRQIDWPTVDADTLVLVAGAAISRADREIASRPGSDWMIDDLVATLGSIGTIASLPLAHARRVLDCLQRLGRSTSRATSMAVTVERELRSRENLRDR